jgi:hypothetical protein
LFENVAIVEGEVVKENVEEVCRVALMHEFSRDLPFGYETTLGGGVGVGLLKAVDGNSSASHSEALLIHLLGSRWSMS